MNHLIVGILFVAAFLSEFNTRIIRNYDEDDYSSNQEEEYDTAEEDDVTCSTAVNISDVFYQKKLDTKVLTVLKLGPNINLDELTMFEELQNLFQSKNFNNLQFLIVTPNNLSDYYNDEDYEIITNSLAEFKKLIHINESVFNDFGFEFLLDDNNVYLIDNCQRLNFIIVHPWSMIVYPYVKAANLATIYDAPCGICVKDGNPVDQSMQEINLQWLTMNSNANEMYSTGSDEDVNEMMDTTNSDLQLSSTTPSSSENEIDSGDDEDIEDVTNILDPLKSKIKYNSSDEDFVIPLKIIIPSLHIHYDEKNKSHELNEYIVLKTDDVDYHEHLSNQPLDILYEYKVDKNTTINDSKIIVGNKTLLEIAEKQDKSIFVNKQGTLIYKILKSYNISDTTGFDEMEMIDFDIERNTNTNFIRDVRKHYELLKKWLPYKF